MTDTQKYGAESQLQVDKSQEPAVPEWVIEDLPSWIGPFMGKEGLPDPWQPQNGVLGGGVAGLDRWQSHHFITYCPETAKFLYTEYTPLEVPYVKGTLPTYEELVAKYSQGAACPRDKAVKLVKAIPQLLPHPTCPPGCIWCEADRNLDDETLLNSGVAWCNEQARAYVRLCQVAGIPARLICLFYADNATGHVVSEFYADGHWAMADPSFACVFPDAGGKLMSAEEIHHTGPAKRLAHAVYRARFEELLRLPDDELSTYDSVEIRRKFQVKLDTVDEHLGWFGVLNYSLPR